MSTTFSNRLRQIRTRRMLSVSHVADALGISPSTYREWEYGRKISGHENYLKLATLFNISLDELLRGEIGRELGENELMKNIIEIEKILERHKKTLESFL